MQRDNHSSLLAVVIPSWSADAPCVLESAGRVLDSGVSADRVAVAHCVDRDKPLPEVTVNLLRRRGINVIEHDYCHARSMEGIRLLPVTLFRWAEIQKADYVVKVDSDTLVNRWDRVEKAVGDGVLAAAWAWPGTYWAGCCSLYSRRALKYLVCPKSYDRLQGYVTNEDRVIHYLLTREFGFDAIRYWWHDRSGGFARGWQYGKDPWTMEECAERFDVVTFGNRCRIPGGCKGGKREEMARTMAKFRKALHDGKDVCSEADQGRRTGKPDVRVGHGTADRP